MAQSETAVLELRPQRDEQAVKKALETIVQALQHDPVTLHLCREGQAEGFMRALLASYLADGAPLLVLVTPDFSSAALLEEVKGEPQAEQRSASPPDDGAASRPQPLAALLQRPAALQRLKRQPRLGELAARHGGALSVHFVAVAPGMQGRGLGSWLLRGLCAAADARALPLYLEATTQRSRALYAKHGFAYVEGKPLDGGDGAADAPVLAVMVRQPQPVAAAAAAGPGP